MILHFVFFAFDMIDIDEDKKHGLSSDSQDDTAAAQYPDGHVLPSVGGADTQHLYNRFHKGALDGPHRAFIMYRISGQFCDVLGNSFQMAMCCYRWRG